MRSPPVVLRKNSRQTNESQLKNVYKHRIWEKMCFGIFFLYFYWYNHCSTTKSGTFEIREGISFVPYEISTGVLRIIVTITRRWALITCPNPVNTVRHAVFVRKLRLLGDIYVYTPQSIILYADVFLVSNSHDRRTLFTTVGWDGSGVRIFLGEHHGEPLHD